MPVDFKFVIRTEILFDMLVINVHTSSPLNQFDSAVEFFTAGMENWTNGADIV